MGITFEDIGNQYRRIDISGRLDIPGTEEIAVKFAAMAVADQRKVIVDLTQVSFLASIGIRAIITNAKALQSRNGKMILHVGDNVSVAKTLTTTGVDSLIPMFTDFSSAERAALE